MRSRVIGTGKTPRGTQVLVAAMFVDFLKQLIAVVCAGIAHCCRLSEENKFAIVCVLGCAYAWD